MIDGGLRQLFHTKLSDFDWVAIESGGTGLGIPDSNYCSAGVEGWIEFKRAEGARGLVTYRPGQLAWIHRRVRVGGRVWVAARHLWLGEDDLYLVLGHSASYLATEGARGIPPLMVDFVQRGGPRHWNWTLIADRLLA